MKRWILAALALILATSAWAEIKPEEDKAAFQSYYKEKYPQTKFDDFINGVYSIDAASREQWEAIEEFPPYEIAIEDGREIWEKKFANGKTIQSCFKWPIAEGIRQHFPHWEEAKKRVLTLELALNECYSANGEKPLKYKKGKMAELSAFISYQSRGKAIKVEIPNDDAMAAYQDGRKFYYTKRGQLNMSCADCHYYNTGKKVRTEILSPSLGHVSHWPVYRSKWQAMGTLHRRFGGCNKNIRAKPFKAQSAQYRNLEYFITYMSNDLYWNGPGVRK